MIIDRAKKIWLPENDLPRVVIIGAGFAGISLIKELRDKQVSVVLIDKNNFHQFQPLLYQVATSGLGPMPLVFLLGSYLKGIKIFFLEWPWSRR